MKKYGLIGQRLTHSYSKILHGFLADYDYQLLPIQPEELEGFLAAGAFDGLNVTIPYKQAVLPYVEELSDTARAIGCVNTLLRRPDGSLYGDNTDAYGFLKMAQRAGIDFRGQKTLVLGGGGTSLTACAVIRREGGEPVVVSRQGENNYENLDWHGDAAFLVNTTPVGMYPDPAAALIDLKRFDHLRGVLDVIYNPLRTRLLQQAQALSLPWAGGLTMLVYQAVRACELFTGRPVPLEAAQQAEGALRLAALNLVLVGMPGCGKTTVGRALERLTGYPFLDMDEEIEKEAGMSIPQIFKKEGESGFRLRETAVIARYGKEKGRILATGGGAVKVPANREALRFNGYVVHLTRKLEALATEGRPLSKDGEALLRLWKEREPLYRACADHTVENKESPEQCAREIWEAIHEDLCVERP